MAQRGPVGADRDVVEQALGDGGEEVCAGLVRQLRGADKVAAERAARGLKKISERNAMALYGLRRQLLREAERAGDVRVQWNLTIVIGRLPLRGREKALAVELMFERLRDAGSLNRTFALQGLVDLSRDDASLRARVRPLVLDALESDAPAVRARARRLLKQSGRHDARGMLRR